MAIFLSDLLFTSFGFWLLNLYSADDALKFTYFLFHRGEVGKKIDFHWIRGSTAVSSLRKIQIFFSTPPETVFCGFSVSPYVIKCFRNFLLSFKY